MADCFTLDTGRNRSNIQDHGILKPQGSKIQIENDLHASNFVAKIMASVEVLTHYSGVLSRGVGSSGWEAVETLYNFLREMGW